MHLNKTNVHIQSARIFVQLSDNEMSEIMTTHKVILVDGTRCEPQDN